MAAIVPNAQQKSTARRWMLWIAVLVFVLLTAAVLFFYLQFWPGLRPAIGPTPKAIEQPAIRGSVNETGLPLKIPAGFKIETFASGLGSARFMTVDPKGHLLVSIPQAGHVVALADTDRDGDADRVSRFLQDLNAPHGLAFHKGYLYVAEMDKVTRYKYTSNDDGSEISATDPDVVIPKLPSDGGHLTRTVVFGPDGKMYVSVGSSGNLLKEDDPRRAAVLRANDDGSDLRVFAKGLRNSVGLAWHPVTNELWATDNGRDWLGDNLPPDEINILQEGGDYGWPYAYGDRKVDPEFNNAKRAAESLPPKIEIQAHSAPLGLTFLDSDAFGSQYKDDLFVCFHGSWNRSVPTGYKVVRYHMKGPKKDEVDFAEDFIGGWLTNEGALGRPVDVIVGADQALYISDDKTGNIYRVTKI